MAADRNTIRQAIDDLGDLLQQTLGVRHRSRRSLLEHRSAVLVDELDTQAFRRLIDHHLLGQGGDVGIVVDRLVYRFGGMREVAVLCG